MARKAKENPEVMRQTIKAPQKPKEQAPKEKRADVVVPKPKVVEPLDPTVEKAMRLNPHMKSMWITSRGFVHQATAPEYLRKDAKFYVNKYYKQ